MTLLTDLQKRRDERCARIGERVARATDLEAEIDGYRADVAELDIAIAALEAAAPQPDRAEGEDEGAEPDYGSKPEGYRWLTGGVQCRCVRSWTDGRGHYACRDCATTATPHPDFGGTRYLSTGRDDNASGQDPIQIGAAGANILDAQPEATILRQDVPLDAAIDRHPDGSEWITKDGEPHRIVSAPEPETGPAFSIEHEESPDDQHPEARSLETAGVAG